PYERSDTLHPVDESVRLLARQIDRLHRATGRPVAIVAESEGALVATAYVLGRRPSDVDDLVLLSPLVEPGRVYYPPRGHPGWGLAGGWLLRLLARSVKALAGVDLSPDSPLMRSLADHAPALRAAIGCTPALVTQVVVFPLADAVAAPPGRLGDDVIVVPAFHGGLLEDGSVGDALRRLVTGGRPATPPGWSLVERITRAASAAWQVPGLPVGLNLVWTAGGRPTGAGCAAAARELAQWLRGATRRPRPAGGPRSFSSPRCTSCTGWCGPRSPVPLRRRSSTPGPRSTPSGFSASSGRAGSSATSSATTPSCGSGTSGTGWPTSSFPASCSSCSTPPRPAATGSGETSWAGCSSSAWSASPSTPWPRPGSCPPATASSTPSRRSAASGRWERRPKRRRPAIPTPPCRASTSAGRRGPPSPPSRSPDRRR